MLDWELSTLGDPLADLGLLLVYWAEPADDGRAAHAAPTVAPGFPSRAELVDRYAGAHGAGRLRRWTTTARSRIGASPRSSKACSRAFSAGQYGGLEQFASFGKIVEQLADAGVERRAPLE